MNEEATFGGFGFVLVVGAIWLGVTVYNQNKTIEQLKTTIQDCSDSIDEANSNIDDLNNQISDAQSEAWSDYDSMGDTLDGLTTGNNVDGSDCAVPTK